MLYLMFVRLACGLVLLARSAASKDAELLVLRGLRSAVASLRTTCSGVCLFLVAMLMSSLPARNAGRKTLKRPGSTTATKGGTASPGCIYIDPPDPEGRIRISAAVTGELPGQALSVVFAVRPDDEVPAVRADPPSLGGKMLG